MPLVRQFCSCARATNLALSCIQSSTLDDTYTICTRGAACRLAKRWESCTVMPRSRSHSTNRLVAELVKGFTAFQSKRICFIAVQACVVPEIFPVSTLQIHKAISCTYVKWLFLRPKFVSPRIERRSSTLDKAIQWLHQQACWLEKISFSFQDLYTQRES